MYVVALSAPPKRINNLHFSFAAPRLALASYSSGDGGGAILWPTSYRDMHAPAAAAAVVSILATFMRQRLLLLLLLLLCPQSIAIFYCIPPPSLRISSVGMEWNGVERTQKEICRIDA